jgi:hypothetical protein
VLVGWTGTYGTVDVLYNKTGIFTASYSSVTGLTGTTTTIRGLSSSTKYYFRIRPYSDTGMRERTAAWRTSRQNESVYIQVSGCVWFVVYGVVVGGVHDGGRFVEHIQRGRSGKRGADGAHKHDHHNRAKQSGRLHLTTPSGYGTTGTSKSIVITKTNYTPIINNVYASSSG